MNHGLNDEIDLSRFQDLRHPALIDHVQRVGLTMYDRTAALA